MNNNAPKALAASRRKCVFCGGPADSREHVIAKRLCQRAQMQTLTVIPGIHTVGEGTRVRQGILLDSLTVRCICRGCNNGWMNDLETWFDKRLGYLIEPTWPRLAQCFVELAIQERQTLACWLMKSAVTFDFGAMKRKLPVEFPADMLFTIREGIIPDYCWIDLAFSQFANVGAMIGRFFRTVNGGIYQPGEVCTKFSFHFVLQMNHLLLRLGRAPGSRVEYDPHCGPKPIRIYPDPDRAVSTVPEFADFMSFHDSLVLTTWDGCAGNISRQATER